MRRSRLAPAVRNLRAVEAGHRILLESRIDPGRVADQARHVAAGRRSYPAAEQARMMRSRADLEDRCYAGRQVGMMWAVRCQCRFRPRMQRGYGCSQSRCWMACYAVIT